MSPKQLILIVAGIVGIALVVICPKWVYFHEGLQATESDLGHRFITHSPGVPSIPKIENGRKIIYVIKEAKPQIDYRESFLRIGLIILAVICGILALGAKSKYDRKTRNLERRSLEVPASS